MTLHKKIREASHGILYENYMQGNTLYAFDLTPDLCSADHFNLLFVGLRRSFRKRRHQCPSHSKNWVHSYVLFRI